MAFSVSLLCKSFSHVYCPSCETAPSLSHRVLSGFMVLKEEILDWQLLLHWFRHLTTRHLNHHSNCSYPLLIPSVQALNVLIVPLGAFLSAAYPLSSQPPYVLSWLNDLISAQDMMHPDLLKKLVLNNFCTIPGKLLLQLTTAFREGGLRDRSGKFFYKDYLHESNVPILALAGDHDLICPPEAVHGLLSIAAQNSIYTVKLIPEHLITYKVFGELDGPHYAHYDLVGGRLAAEQLYPCIIEFLTRHDSVQEHEA